MLIKCDYKDIYNVTTYFYFSNKDCSFYSIILKKYITVVCIITKILSRIILIRYVSYNDF